LNHKDFIRRFDVGSDRRACAGTGNGTKRAEIPGIWNRARLRSFSVGGPKREDPLSRTPEFDREQALVCMALAFCLAGASTSIIYRLLG